MFTRGLGPQFDNSKCVIKVIKQLTFCSGITSANFEGGGARLALTRAVHSKFRMGGIGSPPHRGGDLRGGQGSNWGDWRVIRDKVNVALKKNERP